MKRITRERWQRVEAVFDEAFELPAAERPGFLDRACADDADLREQVEALLSATSFTGGILETPVMDGAAAVFMDPGTRPPEPGQGDVVGRYKIVERIGAGGMGTVYLAERADGAFEQRVALKLIRSGLGHDDFLRRFLRERQILARLEHPHIARLVDGGADDRGQPFFAMEYVAGVPLSAYCDKQQLDVRARLALFAQVCEAVHYAHQNLVVHRDLKPSNVLVTQEGQVKLLDFGIAKVLHEGEEENNPDATRIGLRVLTPDYAAPEQVRGEPVTTATDVYALGAMLYELVSGRRPHRLSNYTAAEVEREVCLHDPLPPSTAVLRTTDMPAREGEPPPGPELISNARATTAERLRRLLRGDLDAIVMQALHKDPARRYASAESLLRDLQRFGSGEPVTARRESVAYRVSKFVRRHAVGVAAAALVTLSLLAGLAGTTWQARVAAGEAAKAQEVSAFLTELFGGSDPEISNGERVTARELLDEGARRVDEELSGQPLVQAQMLGVLGEIHRKLGLFDRADSLLDRALRLQRELGGPTHPDVATVLAAIGNLRQDQGRSAEAAEAHRLALEIRENELGRNHQDVARSLRHLASVLRTRGEVDEAEALVRRAIAINTRIHGDVHPEVASDLEILTNIHDDRGDYDAAAATARRTLDIREATIGPNHLETATARNNLAVAYLLRGDLEEAERLFQEVRAFDLLRLGEMHPHVATITNNLAYVMQRKGNLEQAEILYRRALALDSALYGDKHEYVGRVMNNLGVVRRDLNDIAEADALFGAALSLFRELFDDGHPEIGTAHAHLATVAHRRGDHRLADSLYVEAISRLRESFPDGHPRLASALLGRGRLLMDIGEAPGAEALIREAIRMREASLGSREPFTIDAHRTLADCLIALGRLDEAETTLLAVWHALGETHWAKRERADAARSLIVLYERWNRTEDAAQFRQALLSEAVLER